MKTLFRSFPRAWSCVSASIWLTLSVTPLAAADPHSDTSPAVGPSTPVTLEWIEAQSATLNTNHPALKAARARFDAANSQAAGTRRFADPTVRLGGSVFDERHMMARDEGNLVYGLEQKLPVLGKESAARAQAEAEAGVAGTRVESLFQQLRMDLARTVLDAALADETVRIDTEDLAWIDLAVRTAESRFQSNQGTSVEVLRLQNERTRRVTQLANDRQRAAAARAWVNHALGREPLSEVPAFVLPEIAPSLESTPDLLKRATANGPLLRELDRERRAAAATVESTRRSSRPDLAVGIEGREYAGDAGFRNGTLTLSLNLPWWNRAAYRRDLERDRSRLRAVEQDSADAALSLRNELHHELIEISNARREALASRDELLPRTEQAVTAAMTAWTSNRGLLGDVLDARRMRLETRLGLARAIAEQWTRIHVLSRLCGLTARETLQLTAQAHTHP